MYIYAWMENMKCSIFDEKLCKNKEYHEKQKKTLELNALIVYGLCRIGIAIM